MIKSLTSLRGVFIFFIFFHHCLYIYPGGGTMAVAFFFVLGGFSMTLGYKDKVLRSTFDFKLFILRRCTKFYPLHWMTLLASIPLVIAAYNWKYIPLFFINAALFQTWIPLENVYMSFNLVSWYLADTMFFAVMFPFLIRWITNSNTSQRSILIASMAILYIAVVIILPNELHHAVFYVSPYMRLLDFIFGILLALGYMKLKETHFEWRYGKGAGQFLLLLLIVLLVIESCLLPVSLTLYAPVYWVGIACLIIVSALTEHRWGGQFCSRTNTYCALAS